MTERKTQPYYLPQQITRRAYELLRDGKWHDFEVVLLEVGQVVPPGVAVRKAEQIRVNATTRPGRRPPPQKRVKTRTPEQLIAYGRRAIVRPSLSNPRVYEHKGKKIRLIDTPSVIVGDRRRGEMLLPALDSLAETFWLKGHSDAFEEVRQVAHGNGLHLARCPEGCTLTPRHDNNDVKGDD